jgi:hypothetical protein
MTDTNAVTTTEDSPKGDLTALVIGDGNQGRYLGRVRHMRAQ